jgi:hypothetical protein
MFGAVSLSVWAFRELTMGSAAHVSELLIAVHGGCKETALVCAHVRWDSRRRLQPDREAMIRCNVRVSRALHLATASEGARALTRGASATRAGAVDDVLPPMCVRASPTWTFMRSPVKLSSRSCRGPRAWGWRSAAYRSFLPPAAFTRNAARDTRARWDSCKPSGSSTIAHPIQHQMRGRACMSRSNSIGSWFT